MRKEVRNDDTQIVAFERGNGIERGVELCRGEISTGDTERSLALLDGVYGDEGSAC